RLMHVVYSPRYHIDIGLHVFPTEKYRLVHAQLFRRGVVETSDVIEPQPATWEQLALVHTTRYLDQLKTGMTAAEAARRELPWSREMVEGFRVMVGGTIEAARIACGAATSNAQSSTPGVPTARASEPSVERSAFRVCVHVGGGLHHAFPDHGEGFCPFNDV